MMAVNRPIGVLLRSTEAKRLINEIEAVPDQRRIALEPYADLLFSF